MNTYEGILETDNINFDIITNNSTIPGSRFDFGKLEQNKQFTFYTNGGVYPIGTMYFCLVKIIRNNNVILKYKTPMVQSTSEGAS